jgi:xylulokinase
LNRDRVVLTIDLGTSAVKVAAVTADGQVLTLARQPYRMEFPSAGWVEQDPEEWWESVCRALRQAMAAVPGQTVCGIGLSGQMKGLVVIDQEGRPLRPCIVYTDVRSKEEANEIQERYGEEIRDRTGARVRTPATVTKLVWVQRHEPAIYEQAWRFLLPKDFIRLRLSGAAATDVTDAAGTLLYDLRKQEWAGDLAARLGLNPEHCPEVLHPASISGLVTPQASAATAVPAGTPVVAGAADMACTVLGAGAISEGDTSITLSTAGQVLTVSRRFEGVPGASSNPHVIADLTYLMCSAYAGGYSLDWILRVLDGGAGQFQRAEADAAEVRPGSDGLLFLPYLLGTGSPSFDALTRGAFLGVSAVHTRRHLVRAVMEGVAYHLRLCVEVLEEAGYTIQRPVVGAGGSRSALWRQIVSDVLSRELRVPAVPELATLGAAILAAVGTGLFGDIPGAVRTMVRYEGRVEPRGEVRTDYELQYRRFGLATEWLVRSGFDHTLS